VEQKLWRIIAIKFSKYSPFAKGSVHYSGADTFVKELRFPI
jgi:hypothetical protein